MFFSLANGNNPFHSSFSEAKKTLYQRRFADVPEEEAIKYYKRAIELDEEIADVFYNLANAQYLLKDVDEAIKNYKKALDLNPKKVECFYNIGNSYCNKNDYQQAIQFYLKAIGLDPLHDPAFYNLGYAYHRTGQL